MLALFVLLLCVNSNVLFLFGYETTSANGTNLVICYTHPNYTSTKWVEKFGKIHLFIYSIIPWIFIVIANMLLIQFLCMNKMNKKQTKVNKIVILMTFSFILMTLPTAIASFYYNYLKSFKLGSFLILLFNSITFSFHAFNFFIFVFENKTFKNKLKSVYRNSRQSVSQKNIDETQF